MELLYTNNFEEFRRCLDKDLSQKDFIRILKRLESCIVGLNGEKAANMDIIEIAENLQASKNFQSVQRNTLKAFTIDAEVKAGNTNYEIPRFIHFKLINNIRQRCSINIFDSFYINIIKLAHQ